MRRVAEIGGAVRADRAEAGPVSALDGEQLAALRAQVRCGRSGVPALHVVEADAQLTQWWLLRRDRVAACGETLTWESPVPDFEDCPGCPDCTRYCSARARAVARFAIAESSAV